MTIKDCRCPQSGCELCGLPDDTGERLRQLEAEVKRLQGAWDAFGAHSNWDIDTLRSAEGKWTWSVEDMDVITNYKARTLGEGDTPLEAILQAADAAEGK